MNPNYLKRLGKYKVARPPPQKPKPKPQKPPRPVGHQETVNGTTRVVLHENEMAHWPQTYGVENTSFWETDTHRSEMRWTRRLYPHFYVDPTRQEARAFQP